MHALLLAQVATLPWLQGFFLPQGVTEQGSRDVLAEVAEWRAPEEDCVASAYGGLTLRADVTPASDGDEQIIASYTQGIFVLDGTRHLIAQAPAFTCEGSADELVALAAGDAGIRTPVVALAATQGGRNENVTWLMLYRVAASGELQPVFAGEVERHEAGTTRTGIVTLVPGGLVYRDTRGSLGMWLYDSGLGRYVELFTSEPNT
jgi:hypothetical protein